MVNFMDLTVRKMIPKEEYYKMADCKYFKHSYNIQFHFKGWGRCHNPNRDYLWCDHGYCKDQVTHDGEMPYKKEEEDIKLKDKLKKWVKENI